MQVVTNRFGPSSSRICVLAQTSYILAGRIRAGIMCLDPRQAGTWAWEWRRSNATCATAYAGYVASIDDMIKWTGIASATLQPGQTQALSDEGRRLQAEQQRKPTTREANKRWCDHVRRIRNGLDCSMLIAVLVYVLVSPVFIYYGSD
eukprot:COSAG02_NODE_1801_length_10895_cov_4.369767_14_plen_148_part_00